MTKIFVSKVLSRSEVKGLKPSRPLAKAGASLWASVINEYDLSDAGGRQLLLLACESLDRVEALRSQIDKEGEFVTDFKGNRRDNPLLRHELANRAFIAKALGRLGLALETPVRGVGRPPRAGLGVDRPVACASTASTTHDQMLQHREICCGPSLRRIGRGDPGRHSQDVPRIVRERSKPHEQA